MHWPPDLAGLTLNTLRRLQGAAQLEHANAQDIRARASTLLERLAASEVLRFYGECIDACRAAIAAHRRRAGWPEYQRPASPSHRRSTSPSRLPGRGVTAQSVSEGPSAVRLGVAGVLPPPVMGHGRPAFTRAGSAATNLPQSGNDVDRTRGHAPPT